MGKCRMPECAHGLMHDHHPFCRGHWGCLPIEMQTELNIKWTDMDAQWRLCKSSAATRDAVHEFQIAVNAACEAMEVKGE